MCAANFNLKTQIDDRKMAPRGPMDVIMKGGCKELAGKLNNKPHNVDDDSWCTDRAIHKFLLLQGGRNKSSVDE
jgi:hypothetical protein